MELTLTRTHRTQVKVICERVLSHTFDMQIIPPLSRDAQAIFHPPDDPVAYGQAIYQALFPLNSEASQALSTQSERILLVTTDNELEAIAWEYAHSSEGFLVCDHTFVRGLPSDQRIAPPALENNMHIIAVPSHPLDADVPTLNIEGEWQRLKEIIGSLPFALTLERVRPPTVEQLRRLVSTQQQRVIHFMGHGGRDGKEAVLYFEQENGALERIDTRDLVRCVRGTTFLVALNACVSATPGETHFSNIAASLVRQKVPYALGMCFSITDEDARIFSRRFYEELARGVPIEEALQQTRATLAKSKHRWVVGVPVLYTALAVPAGGFPTSTGRPVIHEHQPPLDLIALPHVEGTFQGRIDNVRQLGTALTDDSRPRIITIYGPGGQGKTALAREAAERFAFAWPGGVWATSLENLPDRATFVRDLARFLRVETQDTLDQQEIERRVQRQLKHRRLLIVLDNAETLVEAVDQDDSAAIQLGQFLQQLPGSTVSLLVTSRIHLGWNGEVGYELKGLSPREGAELFIQCSPQRAGDIEYSLARELSERLGGHPLSLRILGSAFNSISSTLSAFLEEYESQLLEAEHKYREKDHRHRSLYICIDLSVRHLNQAQRETLSKLWIFHAPFLLESATAILDANTEEREQQKQSPIQDHLYQLWQRSLLVHEYVTVGKESFFFYRLLPTIRLYVKGMLQTVERKELQERFGKMYFRITKASYELINYRMHVSSLAHLQRDDIEQGIEWTADEIQTYYLCYWGSILGQIGNKRQGVKFLERALEIAQVEKNASLEGLVLGNLALVNEAIGQPQQALTLGEQALTISQELGDRVNEALTLSNLAAIYQAIGQLPQALTLGEQALSILREVGDRSREARTLSNLGAVYQKTGQPLQARTLFEQALSILREVGDRGGEASALVNLAEVYRTSGNSEEALKLCEQALPITREVGARSEEALTLSNLAAIYQAIGQLPQALTLGEQALSIFREVGDRSGEARTLMNLGMIYQKAGQLPQASLFLEQALPIMQEVSNRAGEAMTLNNLGIVTDQPLQALELYEQALPIMQEVSNRAGEAMTLANLASLLYKDLNRQQEGVRYMEEAIAILIDLGLSHDAAGNTIADLQRALQRMQAGIHPNKQAISEEDIQITISNTIGVLTIAPEEREQWRKEIADTLQKAQQGREWQAEVEFLTTVLAILDGDTPMLAEGHPYASVIRAIQEGIAKSEMQEVDTSVVESNALLQAIHQFVTAKDWDDKYQVVKAQQELLFQPEAEHFFQQCIQQAKADTDQQAAYILKVHLDVLQVCKAHGIATFFERIMQVQREQQEQDTEERIIMTQSKEEMMALWVFSGVSIAMLKSINPQEKMAFMQQLTALQEQTPDDQMKALYKAIQLALLGGDLAHLGNHLTGLARQAWDVIVAGVQQDDTPSDEMPDTM